MKKSLLFFSLLFLGAFSLFGCSSTDSSDDDKTGGDDDSESEWCETAGNCGTFVDARDNQTYKWTKIGTQVWMAQNLNFGTQIVGTAGQKDATSTSAEKYCFNNDEAICDTHGGLYQWHSAMGLPFSCNSPSGCAVDAPHRGICPEGWHIPTREEWVTLNDWVDEDNGGAINDAAQSLRSTIEDGSRYGTDAYGWTALYGGHRDGDRFDAQGDYGRGYWWSASDSEAGAANGYAWYRYLDGDNNDLRENSNAKNGAAYSVRCVQDESVSSSSSQTGDDDDPESEWCKTKGNCGTLTDTRDSTTYKWTKIGDQVWMAQNLNFGTSVSGSEEQKDATASSAEKYCYDNGESNCDLYGGLYQWHSAMALPFSCNTTSGCTVNSPHRGICPTGWHVPTQAEWASLDAWIDEENDGEVNNNEGISLKSTTGWAENGNGADAYGWTALPCGLLDEGSFDNQSEYCRWWSASESSENYAWYRLLLYEFDFLREYGGNKGTGGFSVRCVKD